MKNTKKELNMINNYHNGKRVSSIYDIYERPSQIKAIVFKKCYEDYLTNAHVLWNFRETGHNCQAFSVAYMYKGNNGEKRLKYFTAYNTYDFEIIEEEEEK